MHGVKIDASIISHVSKRGHENLYSWRWNFYSCCQFVETFEARLTGAICFKQKWLADIHGVLEVTFQVICLILRFLKEFCGFFLKGNLEGVKDILEVRFWWAGAGPPMHSNSFQIIPKHLCSVHAGAWFPSGGCMWELPIGKPAGKWRSYQIITCRLLSTYQIWQHLT